MQILKPVGYVHLHVHSSYSLLEGALKIGDLVKAAGADRQPALALTDTNNLFGALEFSEKAAGSGIQPIAGMQLSVAFEAPEANAKLNASHPHIVLLAKDETGYGHLLRLASRAYFDNHLGEVPRVSAQALKDCAGGLIALTGGMGGPVDAALRANRPELALARLESLKSAFGEDRLYVELQRHGLSDERAVEGELIRLADRHGLSLVATNEPYFAKPEDYEAHDALLAVAEGRLVSDDKRRRLTPRHAFKTRAEMAELFRDLPDALQATVEIAMRCAYRARTRKPILPSFGAPSLTTPAQGTPEGAALQAQVAAATTAVAKDIAPDEAAELRRQAEEGLTERLRQHGPAEGLTEKDYRDRLEYEIRVITNMKFPGYFLIVSDFIKWAKEHDIPVGPGRGSGAGSLVAWSLLITDLDPIRFGLLFERFLNPERVSMPDFDIDFCETRRGEVIRYVQQKYGEDHVAQIITFGKLKARAVLRDTGRILQMSYGQVDRLCKMVPNHPTDPWPLPRALNGVLELKREYDRDPEVKRLIDLAMQLEGLPRNSSTHAAGVVIGDRPLAQLVPLYRDPRSDMPVTQFDMKFVEDAGLVKFDFLGLKTLSVLRKAVDLLTKRHIDIDLSALPWDDVDTYKLLQSGDTVGVFQLESEGMRRTLAAVKPTNFGDIIALVSLYRPGPMDNIPLFGRRKNGLESIEYPHDKLAGILSETYGIFVYQEQVMQAAQILAGYSLGDADLLRRAMGKKVQAEMDAQRQRFVDGCKTVSDIPAAKANELFDLIDKFAGYGFNKSHAAAYALLAYQTAWLKTHYPHEFYAASMCFDMHQSEKLSVFVDDMRRNGVALAGPDINHSEAEFTVERTHDGYAVRYALAGLRNVGEKAMDAIVAEREANGPFASLDDLFRRLPAGSMNRRGLEALAAGGALDCLEPNRAQVTANAELLMAVADEAARARTSGQGGLFGGDDHAVPATRLAETKPWSRADQMAAERENFGFYFAAHPVEEYRAVASANGARSYGSLMSGGGEGGGGRSGAVMAALVENVQKRKTKRGKDFVMADFSDSSGLFSASCFEEALVDNFVQWAKDGVCVLLNVELDRPNPDEPPRVTVRNARPLDSVTSAARMMLKLDVTKPEAIAELAMLLPRAADAKGEVLARLRTGGAREPLVRLGTDFRLDSDLIERLIPIEGLANVALTARPERHLRLVE